MTIFLCENTPDGILTGIYDAWASRLGHRNVRLETEENVNYELFCDYHPVKTDGEKAEKVAKTIQTRLGEELWSQLYHAALSSASEKAEAIYRTVVLGLSLDKKTPGGGKRLMENLKEPCVFQIFAMSRAVGNEAHRYLGFLRFREMEGGFLFSEICPEGQILPLIGDHFSNRYPLENFLIYDRSHQTFLVHGAGKEWVLWEGEELPAEKLRESLKEQEFSRLWQRFVDTIAIRERQNPGLQKQLLPLKFRTFMTEKF